MDGAVLWRAQLLPGAAYRVLDTDTPQMMVRSELLQLLPIPEINLLFTTLLELSRPGVRLLCSLDDAEQRALFPALLAAAPGAAEPTVAAVAALCARLREVDETRRAGWADKLRAHPLVSGDAASVGPRLTAAAEDTARRVGLLAVPDLRTAARLLTRLDESLTKMPTGGPLADMDTFIAGAGPFKSLVGFAASSAVAAALAGTV
jgi:hypothetical protein